MYKFQKYLIGLIIVVTILAGACQTSSPHYLKAPFTALDTLATNDWWNRKTSNIIDIKVPRDQVIAFGIYTTSKNTLKLSAQLFPLYPEETRTVRLELFKNNQWERYNPKKSTK